MAIQKRLIPLCFLTLLLATGAMSTDTRHYISTPRGSDVPDTYDTDEMSVAERQYWDWSFGQNYPNATQIKLPGESYSSTRKLNCHGYAWSYVETGVRVWIGYSQAGSEEVYWNDGSYNEVPVGVATKVSYSGDHSAITSGTANYYYSKWNKYPLMYHHKDYTPGYGTANQFFHRAADVPQEYSSISSALAAAVSGQTVTVSAGSYSQGGNVTIPSGKTLRLNSSVNLSFTGNHKLRVEGTLNATSATFTRSGGQWYGIEFYAGSGNVTGCTIQNALYGAYVYACWYPYIRQCTIQNNSTGIASVSSSHQIQQNYITGNTYGVDCSSYSYVDFQLNNWVKFNTRGVQIDATSPPALGTYSTPVYCSIWGNDWDVWSNYSGTVSAEWNYWGDYPANPMVYGTVDYANALSVEPSLGKIVIREDAGQTKGGLVAAGNSEGGTDTTGIGELDQTRGLELKSSSAEAQMAYASLIARYSMKPVALIALAHLARLQEATGGNALASLSVYATSYKGGNLGDFAQLLTGQTLIRQGATDAALGIFKDVSLKEGSPFEADALYNAGCLLWYRKDAKAEGEGYFRKLIEKFPASSFATSALATLGELSEGKQPSKETAGGQGAPTTYNLASAYPNPFNPSTTLKYALPVAGKVSLIVHDVLGREVAVLAKGTQEAGFHAATWTAASTASGVYFAVLLVTDDLGAIKYKQVNKLLLVK